MLVVATAFGLYRMAALSRLNCFHGTLAFMERWPRSGKQISVSVVQVKHMVPSAAGQCVAMRICMELAPPTKTMEALQEQRTSACLTLEVHEERPDLIDLKIGPT